MVGFCFRWCATLIGPLLRRNAIAISASSLAPNPVQPGGRQVASVSLSATPAMSMWAQGLPATNSSRNNAAVIDPALAPPRFLMSATVELSCLR